MTKFGSVQRYKIEYTGIPKIGAGYPFLRKTTLLICGFAWLTSAWVLLRTFKIQLVISKALRHTKVDAKG